VRYRVALLFAEHDTEAELTSTYITVRPRADPGLAAAAEDAEAFGTASTMLDTQSIRLVIGLTRRIDRQRHRGRRVVLAGHAD
jgi:hypothetical protein